MDQIEINAPYQRYESRQLTFMFDDDRNELVMYFPDKFGNPNLKGYHFAKDDAIRLAHAIIQWSEQNNDEDK